MIEAFEKAEDADRIASCAGERGVTRLVHFTSFDNLIGIVEGGGLYPKREILKRARENADFLLMDFIRWNDNLRLDRRSDCINLSVQYINFYLFRRFEEKFTRCDVWCILALNPILLQKKGCLFTIGNAASTKVRQFGTKGGYEGFARLFGDRDECRNLEHAREGVKRNATTNIQAEVLFPGVIPLSMVNEIIVREEEHRLRILSAFQLDYRGTLPDVVVRPDDFSSHARMV